MSADLPMPRPSWSLRLFLICLIAFSASMPIAWISLSKLFLFLFALCLAFVGLFRTRDPVKEKHRITSLWTVRLVFSILFAFAVSLFWTDVDLGLGLNSLVKHGKLFTIVVLIFLIRSPQEARTAMLVFAVGHSILLIGSWLLFAGIPVPWAVKTAGKYVIFSSYLDQSIIFATMAGVIWHLWSKRLWSREIAAVFSVAALINALLLLEGRTGYLVALTVISLSVMWAMPKQWRLTAVVVTPVVVLAALYVSSAQVKVRLANVIQGSQSYAAKSDSSSSEGWRLNAWRRSLQGIEEKPMIGHGVGSWTMTVKRLEGSTAVQTFGDGVASNPHQEFLLWGVELGLLGPLLLALFLLSPVLDARQFSVPISRALTTVVAALFVSCLFNSTLYDGLIGDFFCIALGLLLALANCEQQTESHASVRISA